MADNNGDSDQLPLRELEARLCTLAGQIAAATPEFLRLLANFEERDGWSGPGIVSCAHWLSWRCGISPRTAREHVRVARALRSLPATADTFAVGRLSFSKVRALSRVATPETEVELVEVGLHSTAGQLERIVRALPTVVPELVPSAATRTPSRPPRLGWEWCDDGTLRVSGRLSAEDGAALLAMLRATSEARTIDDGSEVAGSTSSSEGKAGSFASPVVGDGCNVALDRLRTEQDPSKAPAEVVVHVDADLLTDLRKEADRGTGRCQVDSGPAQTLRVIERLACDGGVRLTCGQHYRALHDGVFSIVALAVSVSGSSTPLAPRSSTRQLCAAAVKAIAAAATNITPESLTPIWDGDAMSPECVDSVIERYAWIRNAEQTGEHPWATAA